MQTFPVTTMIRMVTTSIRSMKAHLTLHRICANTLKVQQRHMAEAHRINWTQTHKSRMARNRQYVFNFNIIGGFEFWRCWTIHWALNSIDKAWYGHRYSSECIGKCNWANKKCDNDRNVAKSLPSLSAAERASIDIDTANNKKKSNPTKFIAKFGSANIFLPFRRGWQIVFRLLEQRL